MVLSASRWRTGVLLAAMALLLPFGIGCHKKSDPPPAQSEDTIVLSGNVKFQRPPLLVDAGGVPLGLDGDSSHFTMDNARGVTVRIYQGADEKDLAGNVQRVWSSKGSTSTDADGYYSYYLTKNLPTIVEIYSDYTYRNSDGSEAGAYVHLFAEDMNSTIPEPSRRYYVMRKGLDGNAVDMQASAMPISATADVKVDFNVKLDDPWMLSPKRDSWTPANFVENTTNRYPGIVREGVAGGPVGTGSRVLAIIDSLYAFSAVYGNPTPGAYMDLHYLRGVSDPLGSYTDYDVSTYNKRRPQAYSADKEGYFYFSTVRGGPDVDDAFNQGVLYTLFGRNSLSSYSVEVPMPLATPGTALYLQDRQDLRPDLAVAMGLPEGMAAALVKSPYLPETTGIPGGGLSSKNPYRDVRDITGLKRDPFSAPNLGALSWEVILKSNSLASPGTPTDWAKITPAASARFFSPTFVTSTSSYTSTAIINDVVSAFSQLGRLQESVSSTETVDLKTIFTDSVLTDLAKPFNVPWPRPNSSTAPDSPYITFYPFWGKDPNTQSVPLPSVSLSMNYAKKSPLGVYSNYSFGIDDPLHPTVAKGEAYTALMYVSKDVTYNLTLSTSPAIPPGATVRVMFGKPTTTGSVSFGSTQYHDFGPGLDPIWKVTPTDSVTGANVTAVYVPIRIHLLSPGTLQPSDISVRLNMIPAN